MPDRVADSASRSRALIASQLAIKLDTEAFAAALLSRKEPKSGSNERFLFLEFRAAMTVCEDGKRTSVNGVS